MEKEFIKFLKDNKIYYKFRYRLKKDNYMTISEFFRRYPFPENYIIFAFIWGDKEHEFWNAMDDKWKKIVRKSKSTNIIRRLINFIQRQ